MVFLVTQMESVMHFATVAARFFALVQAGNLVAAEAVADGFRGSPDYPRFVRTVHLALGF